MNTLVSIIVPCYNQAHFLEESLTSVLAQTYPHWECIIVNDGSPDNIEVIAKTWTQKDTRFKYIAQSNGGLSHARNTGIKVAVGSLILPLDADDILHEMFLEKLVPELEQNDSLAIVTCYSKFFEEHIKNVVHKLKPRGTTYHALLFENCIVATSLYRKSSWQEVGGYDESMKQGFEDWEFWISLLENGKTYKVVEEFLFFYRKSKKSMLTETLEKHRIANLEYVIHKHKDLYIKHFDNTKAYLFFLVNLYRSNELKAKSTIEFKIAKILSKPLRLLGKFTSNKS
ncbi:glycosyl transferase [Yeosuana aromativorans]|uniref:Glycosyl transferase n=1 Tax=Yeosuana aromativorans TaxID=288019 RepID=A0A8J3BFE9_9FLAO|nr:glycosyltransferase family A protein [Yeosuana aromativorans]GGK17506.1 glycosyl transferase [Yeosuana aromativorans]